MDTRVCTKCKITLPSQAFYENKSCNKLRSRCKQCEKDDANERNRLSKECNLDEYLQKLKKRQRDVDKHRQRNKTYGQKYPERNKARIIVYNALRKGIIVKPIICSMCNVERYLIAHHDDYNKPLEVRWICNTCHKIIHGFAI